MSPPLIFEILVQQQQKGGAAQPESFVAAQYATYGVLVDWDGDPTVTANFTGTYDDLVAQAGHGVKSVRVRRGRDDALSAMQMGEATIVLHDPDGFYNPLNSSSAIAANLLPLKPVKITGNNGSSSGLDWPLFFGYIRSIEHDPRRDVQETRIECAGKFIGLNRLTPVGSESPADSTPTVADCIGAVLSELAWDSGNDQFGVSPTTLPDYWLPSGSDGLSEIQNLLAADRGCFFENVRGGFNYEPPAARTAKTSFVTINDTMQALRPGIDLDRVANRARVTRTGGEPQEANDVTSQAIYGVVDVGDIETPYLSSDSDALALAEYLVEQFGSPRSPMYRLELMNRDASMMTNILSTELQARITIADSLGGTSGDYIVEGIEHEITDGGKYHRCSWILSAYGSGTATGHAGVVGGTAVPPPTITYLDSTASAFPTNPKDRDQVYVLVDDTNGVVWHFRYRAASASSYKWEFVGGPPLLTAATGSTTRAVSTYGDLAAGAAPIFTLAYAGDYIIDVGANMAPGSAGFGMFASFSVAGATALDTDAALGYYGAGTNPGQSSVMNRAYKTGLAAGTTIQQKFKAQGSVSGTVDKRFISITPVRVSG